MPPVGFEPTISGGERPAAAHLRVISPSQRPLLWQHITLTNGRHPCPRRDSNPQSQQTMRILGSFNCTKLITFNTVPIETVGIGFHKHINSFKP